MNVDADNFSQVRKLIQQQRLIQKSEIISFDLQFAGLKFENNDRDRSQYMPAQKYQKMSAVARKFCIMQVGITFFIPSQFNQQITAYPFNFFVFPRPTVYADPIVSMQSGCVSFNISNKMDWSRWIEKGITYMKLTQYERITDILEKARGFEQLLQFLEEQNKVIVKDIIQQISHKQKYGSMIKGQENIVYQLPNSAFLYTKKVIQKYFQQNNKLYAIKTMQQLSASQIKNKQDEMIEFQIIRISRQEKEQIQNKKMEQLYGFTLLFEKIWSSGKSLVGHNCFFDLLFMYDAFIAALPYDYQLFKKVITEVSLQNTNRMVDQKFEGKVIPNRNFYDTKFISNSFNIKQQIFEDSTTLQNIYQTIFSNNLTAKSVILAKEYERYDLKNQILHEAGFDSYLTGWIYYQLKQLGLRSKLDITKEYRGKIHLNRSYFYVNFGQFYDGICQYVRVFYIQVIEPKKFATIQVIKKQRVQALKAIREVLKQNKIVKQVITHQGLKQVFIEIRQKKNYERITAIIVKAIQQKKIKNVYGLSHFLQAKNAKQWMDTFNKNGVNVPS